jgi:hypothetical protein
MHILLFRLEYIYLVKFECVCVLRHERQTLGVSKSLLGISQHWKRRYRQKFIDYFNNNAFTGVSFCYTHEERNIFGVDR